MVPVSMDFPSSRIMNSGRLEACDADRMMERFSGVTVGGVNVTEVDPAVDVPFVVSLTVYATLSVSFAAIVGGAVYMTSSTPLIDCSFSVPPKVELLSVTVSVSPAVPGVVVATAVVRDGPTAFGARGVIVGATGGGGGEVDPPISSNADFQAAAGAALPLHARLSPE